MWRACFYLIHSLRQGCYAFTSGMLHAEQCRLISLCELAVIGCSYVVFMKLGGKVVEDYSVADLLVVVTLLHQMKFLLLREFLVQLGLDLMMLGVLEQFLKL